MSSRQASKKRKTLHDYFQHTPVQNKTKPENGPADRQANPPGLSLIENFVTPDEEAQLLSFLFSQPWRTDLARRTMHYGGTYCLMPPRTATPEERKRIESTIFTADPIPPELKWLVDRMVSSGLYEAGARPEFCIVNEYIGSQGISAHVENFRFAEPVCALTLGDGDFMRFHELRKENDGSVRTGKAGLAEKTGRRADVFLPGRSLVVMQGEARRKWQHEIVRGRKGRVGEAWKRVSLTFRIEKKTGVVRGCE